MIFVKTITRTTVKRGKGVLLFSQMNGDVGEKGRERTEFIYKIGRK
jgi:hypothetical protein